GAVENSACRNIVELGSRRASRRHDASGGQRFAKAIVECTDFSALGALDRLVLVGFDLRITVGTAVVAEAVPFIPPSRAAGTGVVFPKPRTRWRPHSDAG